MDMKFVFVLLAVYFTCQSEALYSKSKKDDLLALLRQLGDPWRPSWARTQYRECVTDLDEPGFHCGNGYPHYCMPLNYECNGFVDCDDTGDEHSVCPACPPGFNTCPFLMGGFYRCVHPNMMCDGVVHCADGADEECDK